MAELVCQWCGKSIVQDGQVYNSSPRRRPDEGANPYHCYKRPVETYGTGQNSEGHEPIVTAVEDVEDELAKLKDLVIQHAHGCHCDRCRVALR